MENQHVRLAALIRPDQQEWLRQQSSPLRPVAAVIRDLIDAAMAADQPEQPRR